MKVKQAIKLLEIYDSEDELMICETVILEGDESH